MAVVGVLRKVTTLTTLTRLHQYSASGVYLCRQGQSPGAVRNKGVLLLLKHRCWHHLYCLQSWEYWW